MTGIPLEGLIKQLKDARSQDLVLQTKVSTIVDKLESGTRGAHGRQLGADVVQLHSDGGIAFSLATNSSQEDGGSPQTPGGGGQNQTYTGQERGAKAEPAEAAMGKGTAALADDVLTPRWNAASQNGAVWPPYDTVFKNPPRAYLIACCVSAAVSIMTVIAGAVLVNRLSGCPASSRRTLFVRITAMVPILALTACLGTSFAAVAVVFDLVRHCYLGLSVFWLLELGFDLLGGFEAACGTLALTRPRSVTILEGQWPEGDPGVRGSPSAVSASRTVLFCVWIGATQFVYVNSAIAALLALLALTSLVEHIPPFIDEVAVLLLEGVQLLSALAAVAALAVFFSATRNALLVLKYTAEGKALLVCSAVLLNAVQGTMLRWLSMTGALPDTAMFASPARATMWNNFLLSLEAPVLALLAFKCFPVAELYDPEVRAPLSWAGGLTSSEEERRLLEGRA